MIANILIALIAILHIYILILEIFLWDKPAGMRAFGLKKEFAQQTRTLAANQGLYNGFLAAGLIAGLVLAGAVGDAFVLFFLICVAIAGIFGAATASRKILFIQTVPALLALAAIYANI